MRTLGATAAATVQIHVSSNTEDQDTQGEEKVAGADQGGQLEAIEAQGKSGRSACSEN